MHALNGIIVENYVLDNKLCLIARVKVSDLLVVLISVGLASARPNKMKGKGEYPTIYTCTPFLILS